MIEKISGWLPGIFILLYSISFLPREKRSIAENLFPVRFSILVLFLAVYLILQLVVSKNIERLLCSIKIISKRGKIIYLAVFIYILSIIISSIFSDFSGYAFLGQPGSGFGSIFLIGSLLSGIIFSINSSPYRSYRFFSVAVVIITVVAIVESIGFRPLHNWIPAKIYPAATSGLRTHLSGWYTVFFMLPIFFYRNRPRDIFFWLPMISVIIGVGLAGTTSATIGICFGLLIYLIHDKGSARTYTRRALLIVLSLLSMLYTPKIANQISNSLDMPISNFKDYSSSATLETRRLLWGAALRASLARPLFGFGDETFGYYSFNYLNSEDAHMLIRLENGIDNDYKIINSGPTYYAIKKDSTGKVVGQKNGNLLYVTPHNILINELYSGGLFRILSLIFVVISLLFVMKSKKDFTLMISCLVPYSIYLLAWFYTVFATPIFFASLGIIISDILMNDRNYNKQC